MTAGYSEAWESVPGECPRCEDTTALLALVVRYDEGGEWIDGERCGACGWLLRYCELDILEAPEPIQLPVKAVQVA